MSRLKDEQIEELLALPSLMAAPTIQPSITPTTKLRWLLTTASVLGVVVVILGIIIGIVYYAESDSRKQRVAALMTLGENTLLRLERDLSTIHAKQVDPAIPTASAESNALQSQPRHSNGLKDPAQIPSEKQTNSQDKKSKRESHRITSKNASIAAVVKEDLITRELSKPTATHVDGLTGASVNWLPAETDSGDPPVLARKTKPTPDLNPRLSGAQPEPQGIDALVEGAIVLSRAKAASEKQELNTLPGSDTNINKLSAKPTREQVHLAMKGIAPAIKKCGPKSSGEIHLKLTFSGSTGRVISASPTSDSDLSGTAIGLCAAREAKLARLPKFAMNRIVVTYPFRL
jgi:hypothetical protein